MKKQRDLGLNLSNRRTRKAQFLDEMEAMVRWRELVALIEAVSPRKPIGRPPVGHETMLGSHFLQQWFGLSDFTMEEALFDVALYREFAGLSNSLRLPERVSILRFRHLLEEHRLAEQMFAAVNLTLVAKSLLLKEGAAIETTLIAAPSSTKNQGGKRDPEMHQTKKGGQWYFGMKCCAGVDADSDLVHSVVGTAANINDVTQAHALVHGQEHDIFTDASYQGVDKREDTRKIRAKWHLAMKLGKRRALDKSAPMGNLLNRLEKTTAAIRAKVEHPFGYVKVRYCGLYRNTMQLTTLMALVNLRMAQTNLSACPGVNPPADGHVSTVQAKGFANDCRNRWIDDTWRFQASCSKIGPVVTHCRIDSEHHFE